MSLSAQEAGAVVAAVDESATAQDSSPALKFNFDDQPWPEVLAWFARQANLSLVINDFPPRGFTCRDNRMKYPKSGDRS